MFRSLLSSMIGALIGGFFALFTSVIFFWAIGLSNPMEQVIMFASFILVMMILGAVAGWEFGSE
jgi:hypothetical protein